MKHYKRCSRCKETKPHRDFFKSAATKDGLGGYCKVCSKEAREEWAAKQPKKERKQREKVIIKLSEEERRIKRLEYGYIPKRAKAAKCKECEKYYAAEVVYDGICAVCSRKIDRAKNKIVKRGRPRKYRAVTARGRKQEALSLGVYKAAHKAAKNNRRARLRLGGKFTGKEWTELKHKYNHTCLCCGKAEPEIELTADHVIPLSMGGPNTIDNIQPLCHRCNTLKGTKTVDYR